MEEKKKNIGRGGRVVFGIIVLALIVGVNSGSKTENSVSNQTIQQVKKTSPIQERINRINEIFTEDSAFEKAEEIGSNTIGIYFTSNPSEDIETITRGQSMNLSNEINGVASVKTFVGGVAQMFCVATKGQVNECSDYR